MTAKEKIKKALGGQTTGPPAPKKERKRRTMAKETHRCKFDKDSNLPLCPLASRRCHSPCDLLAQSPGRPQVTAVIATPDGDYPPAD